VSDASNPYDPSAAETPRDSPGAKVGRQTLSGLLLALAILISIPIVSVYVLARPAFDRTLLLRIMPGMTRAQVSTILGAPNDTDGPSQWEYWRWGNAGWVEIAFDDADNVLWVNDESVFP
jgi:hypothetical protein